MGKRRTTGKRAEVPETIQVDLKQTGAYGVAHSAEVSGALPHDQAVLFRLTTHTYRFDNLRLFDVIDKTFHRFGRRLNFHRLPAVGKWSLAPPHVPHPLIDTFLACPIAEGHPK